MTIEDSTEVGESPQPDLDSENPSGADREAKHEAALRLSQTSIAWIASADAKATTIASVLAVVLGLVSIEMAEATQADSLEKLYWAFLALSALSVSLCVGTLWPRTKPRKLLPGVKDSPTFFGDVPDRYEEFLRQEVSAARLREDEREQAFVIARVAAKKMVLVKATIFSFLLTMGVLIVLAFAATLQPPSPSLPISPPVESDAAGSS